MRTTLFAAATVLGLGSTLAGADTYDGEVSRPTRGPNSCGTVQEPFVATGDFSARYLLAPGAQRVVFLNRFGGTYNIAPAATDSATNTASVRVSGNGQARMATIGPMSTAFDWPMVVECVKAHYSKIDVRFVESEPTMGPYVEAVIGGNGSELGFPSSSGILGIASADNFCDVTETGICFTFAEAHGGFGQKNAELCTTIAHEVGHLLALEHETLATDLMSYVPVTQAPSKAFVDMASTCGTYPQQPQNCSCSSSQQNSFNRLLTYVGPRPIEATKPELSIKSPSNGDTVAPVFNVVATASDDMAMADVRVVLDGIEGGNSSVNNGGSYTITVHGALGDHQMTVIARDEAGNETTQTIAVKIAKAQIGDTCVANDSCEGNVCATGEDGNFCTQTCDLADDTCPDDFECAAVGGTSVCVFGGGCGCTTSDPRDAVGAILVFGFGLLLSRRRQRK